MHIYIYVCIFICLYIYSYSKLNFELKQFTIKNRRECLFQKLTFEKIQVFVHKLNYYI